VSYTGTGAVGTYAYTFKVLDDDDLLVTVRHPTTGVETTLTLTTDYTVTGVGVATGGNVVLVTGARDWINTGNSLKVDWVIVIRRVRALKQPFDLRNQGSFFPETHENAFDSLVMIAQQQQDELNRTIKFSETSTTLGTIPSGAYGNKLLGFNSGGTAFELKSYSDVTSALGVLLATNNLSELSSAAAALTNLGIAPLSLATTHNFTNNQAATDLTGETFASTSYKAVVFEYMVERGTTIFATGRFALHYKNSAWVFVDGGYEGDEHGLTFTLSGTTTAQLRLASDNGGSSGTIKIKKHYFTA
jgi:hypothetical protein